MMTIDLPHGWEAKSMLRLSKQIFDYRGRTPKKLGMDWGGGDIPALSAGNVKMGFIDWSAECYFGSEDLYRKWMTQGRPSKDDILFTTEAPLGNVALIPDDRRYILSQRTILLQIDPLQARSKFVAQMMSSEAFQRMLADYSSGSTAKGIQRRKFERLEIAVPPLDEQKSIETVLSDVDALLAQLDRLIAKKRDLKQAAMQQLLTGQNRLKGFHAEWGRATLGELFAFKNGLNKAKHFFGFGTPIVNYMDVFSNGKIWCTRLAGRVSLSKQELSNFDVRKGDVLFTRTSETPEEVGLAAVVGDEPNETVFSGFLLRGRPRSQVLCDEFKAYCFRSSFVRSQIVSKASYTTRALTNGRLLSGVVLPVPPLAEQAAIAAALSDMDTEILALQTRRDKARALKQAMMQELLTGRIRLI